MAATIKFDDGSGFASNCFPVRGAFITNPSANADGAWIVAQRAEQKRRFHAILCSQPKTYSQIKEERRRAEKVEKLLAETGTGTGRHGSVVVNEDDEEPTLDGFFLLRRCCVDDPTDACSISIAGLGITEAKTEDFPLFDNVAYVNAAENYLTIETFTSFPIIRELEMPLNAMRNIQITHRDFPELEILDLSYNNLSPEDLLALGLLPKLRVLHLTGNGFTSLPIEMAKQSIDEDWYKTPRYPALEILMLDDNRLTEVSTFSALAGLRRLKVLSLSKNEIEYVPQLQLVDNNKRMDESRAGARSGRPKSGRRTPRSARSRKGSDQVNSAPKVRSNTPDEVEQHSKLTREDIDLAIDEALADQTDDLPPPFSQLRCIDLSHNKIAEEESVLPVALWPLVSELIIHDNPLTAMRPGMPPLLKSLLVDRCGVDLVRKKPGQVSKPSIEVALRPDRKINSAIPKVPKIPVDTLLAIEGPKLTPLTRTPEVTPPARTPEVPPPVRTPEISRGGSRESQQVRESMDRPSDSRGFSRDSVRSVTFAERAKTSNEASPIPEASSSRKSSYTSASSTPQDKPQSPQSKNSEEEEEKEMEEELDEEQEEEEEEVVTSQVDEVTIEDVKEEEGATGPDVDPVFLTQVAEEADEVTIGHVPRPPSNEQRERSTPMRRRPIRVVVPEKYRGYEALLDDNGEGTDSPVKERDVQSCIRALKYALNHPVTVKPGRVPLDKPHPDFTPYKKTELPPPPIHKTRPERIDSTLRKVKHRSVVTEAPLKEALDGKAPVREHFPEAMQLLSEVQKKYNSVRINSLQEAHDLHSMVQSVVGNNSPTGKKSALSTKSSVR